MLVWKWEVSASVDSQHMLDTDNELNLTVAKYVWEMWISFVVEPGVWAYMKLYVSHMFTVNDVRNRGRNSYENRVSNKFQVWVGSGTGPRPAMIDECALGEWWVNLDAILH